MKWRARYDDGGFVWVRSFGNRFDAVEFLVERIQRRDPSFARVVVYEGKEMRFSAEVVHGALVGATEYKPASRAAEVFLGI